MSYRVSKTTLLVAFALAAAALGVSAVSAAMATSGRAAAADTRVVIGVKHNKSLGSILYAGPKHLTIYAFARDHRGRSSCNGQCVKGWPPVTTVGKPRAVAGAVTADLGTIARSNGSRQATYKGHPLYYFVGDKTAGTAEGQRLSAFGARWYVLSASGREITKAPTTTMPTTTSTTTTSTYTYTYINGSQTTPTTTTPSTTSTSPTTTYTNPYG